MIRIATLLILMALVFASPARACSTSGSSTFCADGWIAQAIEPRRPDSRDTGYGEGSGMDPGSTGDGVYVEGAVVVEEPSLEVEGQL